jgi:hypothetical protein
LTDVDADSDLNTTTLFRDGLCRYLIVEADMTSDKLISREEVLAGLPARRASTLLFLIESRTALGAFTLGRDPPLRPTIQDLERYAPQWASLMLENPRVRAAVTYLLGRRRSSLT